MCCELGNLYNKEAILSALIDKTLPEHLVHIRGLKDVKTLIFTIDSSRDTTDDTTALFVCPITKQEFGGLHPFYALWSTGHVLSDKAIKEMGTESLQEEYGPFTAIDLVKLLPLESEQDDQRAAMHRRRELIKANKKDKKEKKSSSSTVHDGEQVSEEPSSKKRKAEDGKAQSSSSSGAPGIKKLSTASSLVKNANESLKEMENKSEVFKALFHKDNSQDKSGRDLFMNVAGLRYTLG